MRFSGHETFPLRYAWFPSAYRLLEENPNALADDETAIAQLGIGRNMLKALRFWLEAMCIAQPIGRREFALTDFARQVFGRGQLDPYLEDARTLWLLHWNLASREAGKVFAWNYLLYKWPKPEFTRSELLDAFERESKRYGKKPRSSTTLQQHIDIFLHSYRPVRRSARAVEEDVLDCPLTELDLVEVVGSRTGPTGRREDVLAFRRGAKPEVDASLFVYCLVDYWARFRPEAESLPVTELMHGESSIGGAFQLDEREFWRRLAALETDSGGNLQYKESELRPRVVRMKPIPEITWSIAQAYGN